MPAGDLFRSLLKPLVAGFVVALMACAGGPARAALAISGGATSNVSCSAGVCTATARYAVLNATALATMLGSGDVTVESGSVADHIFVVAPLSWVSAKRLTLDAHRSIVVSRQVVVAGPGGLTLTINHGGQGGTLSFIGKGKVAFWDLGSSLVIGGNAYTLANTVDQLAGDIASNPSGFYALANDEHLHTSYTASPIATTFGGIFEGLGNSIFDLHVSDRHPGQRKIGLFAQIGSTGTVRDIGLKVAIFGVPSSYSYVGGLAGESDGTIAHCFVTGSVRGGNYIGGLVGWENGTIADCHATDSVAGGYNITAGGLVGMLGQQCPCHETIGDSDATGSVTAGRNSNIGGLVGTDFNGTIIRSHASGPVSATFYSLVGGLAGFSLGGPIESSYATGSVTVKTSYAGGLVGLFGAFQNNVPAAIDNSYATGRVTGGNKTWLGGLVAAFNGDGSVIENSYATGTVTGGVGALFVGGLLGSDSSQGTLANTYWDLDTSGIGNPSKGAGNLANDPGITGLSDAQMKAALPAGFSASVWGLTPGINGGYPYLLANPPQ